MLPVNLGKLSALLELSELPVDLRELELRDLQEFWLQLIDEEKALFDRCRELDTEDASKPQKSMATRSWWGVLHLQLWIYSNAQRQLSHTLEPYPAYAFERLTRITHDLSKGVVSPAILDAGKGNNGRPMTFFERRDIAHAVYYIQAVKAGALEDQSWNKTVRDTYNVSQRAVRRWQENADTICFLVPKPISAKQATRRMREGGERYSRIGRGAPSE